MARAGVMEPPVAGDGPLVKIGPFCMVAPVAELESWVRDAKPGDRFGYARGQVLARAERTVIVARDYQEAGLVNLLQQILKHADGRRETLWLAERRNAARPLVTEPVEAEPDHALSGLSRPQADAADAEELDAILRAFARAANMKLVAPTNGELADRLDLKDARRVRYLVGKLISAKLIRITDHGPRARRIVTIVSTGKSTVAGRL